MDATRLKLLTNLILAAVAEGETAAGNHVSYGLGIPEGHLYAAVMGRFSLDEFQAAVNLGVQVGCLTRHPGPVIKGTDKLRAAFASAKAKVS
jgi:hypothetical protein